ncbi:MAG: type II toxin-antitoxin system HicB family antitoxin [Chloroflexi bacterium]|nr:type II toxin-antitoxin system HicB family antitoxin [Chloroflexota bacterium]
MSRRYTLLLIPDPDEGGYTVRVPALPGVTTEGDTLEEAIANARDAIALWIRSAERHGEPIPEEELPPQTVTIDVAA